VQAIEATGKDGGAIEHREITDENRAIARAVFLARTKALNAQNA
jgi:hypothetical protein